MAHKPPAIYLACDLQPNSGEGRLARLYMQNAYDLKPGAEQKKSLFSAEPGDILTPALLNGSRWRRAIPAYLWLLWQIIQLHFMRKADVAVLNYLPLWNVFFFLLVPKPLFLGLLQEAAQSIRVIWDCPAGGLSQLF